MLAEVNIWAFAITLAAVIPAMLCLSFLGFLVHRDSQNEPVHLSFPRFIPWSVASRARRVRAEVELEKAKQDLHVQRHASLQKEMVLNDLQEEHYRRALAPADSSD